MAAGAAESATTIATAAIETAPEGGSVSPAAVAAARRRLAALESAAPTEGADVAMWGGREVEEAAPAAEPESPAAPKHGFVRRFAGGIANRTATIALSLTRNAMKFLGVPYVFGGTSTHGFDCSGYVQHVFAMLGLHLPRTADAQFVAGHRIAGAMQAGDLVFFQTYEVGPSHVGIYVGNDHFVHASSSRGVTVSSLHDHYWSARYLGAKRVI